MAGPSAKSVDNESQSGIWETLTPVMIGVAGLGQLASAVVAVYYIQEVISSDGRELALPRKEHEAVAKLTQSEAEYDQAYSEVMDWKVLPGSIKAPLMVSSLLLMFSNFVFVFMDEACFRPFKVTNKIDDPYDKQGLNGDWLSLVKKPGMAAHGLFFIATFIHFAFMNRSASTAKRKMYMNRNEHAHLVSTGQIPSDANANSMERERRLSRSTEGSNLSRQNSPEGTSEAGNPVGTQGDQV